MIDFEKTSFTDFLRFREKFTFEYTSKIASLNYDTHSVLYAIDNFTKCLNSLKLTQVAILTRERFTERELVEHCAFMSSLSLAKIEKLLFIPRSTLSKVHTRNLTQSARKKLCYFYANALISDCQELYQKM